MSMFGRKAALGLMAVALLTLVSSVYTYWRLTNSESLPATSTVTLYPLELRMMLDKTEFYQGELIEVKVFLTNISNRTVRLTNWKPIFDFNITDANEMVVYQWSRNCGWVLPGVKILEAGAELNYTQKSEVFNDATISNVPFVLSKGTYKITEFSVLIAEYVTSGEYQYLEPATVKLECELETPQATITII